MLAFLGFLGIVNVYLTRLNLSIAIVAMVTPESTPQPTANSSSEEYCQAPERQQGEEEATEGVRGEFDWDPGVRGDLLASYYYGYIWTQIPGGWLTNRFGFKRVFGTSMVLASLLTLLTPLAASQGLGLVIACRVLMGFSHGVVFPAMHGAWTHWAHPKVKKNLQR